MDLADAVAPPGEPQRQRRHIKVRPSVAVGIAAEPQKLLAVQAERLPVAVEMLFDEMEGEHVVAGRDRRVRREDGRRSDELGCFVKAHPALDQRADAFEDEERRVPFVGVKNRRTYPESFEHSHAADAEDHLLPDARLLVAAVEPAESSRSQGSFSSTSVSIK